jgi:endonuclease III
MPEPVDYEEKLAKFKDAFETLQNPEADAQLKNRLLKACIEKIIYSRDKPERIRSTAKRVTVNGKRIKPDGLPTGGSWTTPPIELDVKLRV